MDVYMCIHTRFIISTCTTQYGRYIPVCHVAGTRTARYRAVPPKIDCRQSISTVDGRLREKKGRRRRGKEEKKRKEEYIFPCVILAGAPSSHAIVACGSRALFLPREETKHLPVQGERSRRRHRVVRTVRTARYRYHTDTEINLYTGFNIVPAFGCIPPKPSPPSSSPETSHEQGLSADKQGSPDASPNRNNSLRKPSSKP
ncbi:hypothetical protein B296_00003973 [Ensete ventricosum]|uniref:Uncharacterized protein n=1 Tax=Ensete ventricosum TaxID=4639 RepID=A0A426ZFP9_ENSVE|nr:hypothetical protein B296_00003973 [Ensete ventricosum]